VCQTLILKIYLIFISNKTGRTNFFKIRKNRIRYVYNDCCNNINRKLFLLTKVNAACTMKWNDKICDKLNLKIKISLNILKI